jgi:hypothetical protein
MSGFALHPEALADLDWMWEAHSNPMTHATGR